MQLDDISATDRQRVLDVIQHACLYRRLPTEVFDCDPAMFTFFADNPHVLVEVWRVLGISKVRLQPIPGTNSYRADDGAGTRGVLHVLASNTNEQAHNRVLLYAEGSFEGTPFLRPVTAKCVMLLRSGAVRETNDRDYVTVRLDTFVKVDRTTLDLLARTFHPLLGKAADDNFRDTTRFLSKLSLASEKNPRGIERLANKLERIPHDVRGEWVDITYRLAETTSTESSNASRAGGKRKGHRDTAVRSAELTRSR